MNLFSLFIFFPLLSADPVEPIDSTGISYHEKMEDINRGTKINSLEQYLFTESADYSPTIKKSRVKEVSTSHDETWNFDQEGNLISHVKLNNYHKNKYGKYSHTNYYKYDNHNYLVQEDNYDLSIWSSKGTYVDKTNEKIKYDYSPDHLKCKVSGKDLNYSNISNRIVGFEPEEEFEGQYTLDTQGQVTNYKGWFFYHKSSIDYFYSGSDLLKRKAIFDDGTGGFIDSIAYSFSENNKIARHYFSLILTGRAVNYILLETITYNPENKITEIILDPKAKFPVDEWQIFYRTHYTAVYNLDTLMEENEFDSLGRCGRKVIYSYGVSGKNHFVHEVVFCPSDTIGGIDTSYISTSWYTSDGLFIRQTSVNYVDAYYGDHFHPIFYEKPNEDEYSVRYSFY